MSEIGVSSLTLADAYRGTRVLVTGHTGFKGTWLATWLARLGARVYGYALKPETEPSLFEVLGATTDCEHAVGDVRDLDSLRRCARAARPDFVFHLAAQSLVRRGYAAPVETFATNVLGTANVLEAIRLEHIHAPVVIVTSDKCYDNDESARPFRETDALGGKDPYSASKAAAEIVAASYRASYFQPEELHGHGTAIATVRAGNVIGGGDWSEDRLVPDIIRALSRKERVQVRNKTSVRPWQHVLEPLYGYLSLAIRLSHGDVADRARFCTAFNFGPREASERSVQDLVEIAVRSWGGSWVDSSTKGGPSEARMLRLSIERAQSTLGWLPALGFEEAVQLTMDWYRRYYARSSRKELRDLTHSQISSYQAQVETA